ncbi:MAG: hypothetical protein EXR93_05705 [Gemmatimonadetes bacterium]|nr:hypothetical protein [Gemmatimonadota bacterium]
MGSRSRVFMVLALAACRPGGDAARNSLLEADRVFARQSQIHRLDAWLDAVGDSGVVLRLNGAATRGPAGVQDRLAPLFADSTYTLTWEPLYADVSASGELGYTVGLSQSGHRGPSGQPEVNAAKYVTVWRKRADGTWRVALQAEVGGQ